MQLFKDFIMRQDKFVAVPAQASPEPKRTITQEVMEQHGTKRQYEDGGLTPRQRSNRLHPLGGQG